MITTKEDITVAPAVDPTAWWNTDINGYCGFSANATSMFPREYNVATIMAKPNVPLTARPVIKDRGTTTAALRISSDIYLHVSERYIRATRAQYLHV